MGAPINNTCPDINRAIAYVQAGLKDLKSAMNADDLDSCLEYVRDAMNNFEDIEDRFEDLRSDNSKLRDWGHECEKQIKDLQKELDKLPS